MSLLENFQKAEKEYINSILDIKGVVGEYVKLLNVKLSVDIIFDAISNNKLRPFVTIICNPDNVFIYYDNLDEFTKEEFLTIPFEFFERFKDGKFEKDFENEIKNLKVELRNNKKQIINLTGSISKLNNDIRNSIFSGKPEEIEEMRQTLFAFEKEKDELTERNEQIIKRFQG